MITPEALLHCSEEAEAISEQLHQYILKAIVERILIRAARGDDYMLTAQDKHQIDVLQDAGYLLADIQREIAAALSIQQDAIAAAMEQACIESLTYDDRMYTKAGIYPTPLKQSPHMMRIAQRNYEATMGEWKNFTRTMANESQQLFIREMDKAYNLTATGAISYTQAVREAVEAIAKEGVVVTYPSGHTDTIETATLRCVRTGIAQSTAQITFARMQEQGENLVLTSSHLGARPTHELWQGKVFHVDWETFQPYKRYTKDEVLPEPKNTHSKYPDFVQSTGYGTVTGLCGANCRHSFSPWKEGMNNPWRQYDTEENRKEYELQQRQRTLERRIRKTKRECMGFDTAVQNAPNDEEREHYQKLYDRSALKLSRQNAEYNDFCKDNDLKTLSDRIQIAQWDRSQAAKAGNAARREYKEWSKSVGVNDDIKTLADYYDIRYNDEYKYGLLKQYVSDVKRGWISPNASFGNYYALHERIQNEIIGKTTWNGVQIKSQNPHFMQRVLGTATDPNKIAQGENPLRNGVEIDDIKQALFESKTEPKVTWRTMRSGTKKSSMRFRGERCLVALNPETGELVQTNPYSEKEKK